jgi:uncharacterized protein
LADWSYYIIPVSGSIKNDKFILYRPLIKLAFIGNKAMADLAAQLLNHPELIAQRKKEEAVEFLNTVNFFSPDIPPIKPVIEVDTAVLLLTNRCQLRCVYCYAAAGESKPQTLNIDTAKAVIDTVSREAIKHSFCEFILDFHGGGEPTLEWDLMKACIEYARKKPIPARIYLTSNLLWSNEQFEYIINNIDGLSVSMDGAPTTQNLNRPYISGAKSSTLVLQNLHKLDGINYEYGIRLTATEPWSNLSANIEFIYKKTDCRLIQVEPAFQRSRGFLKKRVASDWNKFSNAYVNAFEKARSLGINMHYSNTNPDLIATTFCDAPNRAIIVNPSDDIVACYEVVDSDHPLAEISVIGKVEHGKVLINKSKKKHLNLLLSERSIKCNQCFCKWTCAGGCYSRTFVNGENGHLKYGEYCSMVQEITRYQLLDLIARQNGVWKGIV